MYIFIYLKDRVGGGKKGQCVRERTRTHALPSSGLLPEWLQWSVVLDQAIACASAHSQVRRVQWVVKLLARLQFEQMIQISG